MQQELQVLERVSLEVSLGVDLHTWLDFDPDYGVQLFVGLVKAGEDDFQDVVDTRLEHTVEALIAEAMTTQDYSSLYCVAHEFCRLAEQLREVSGKMEDSMVEIGHLYQIELPLLPDDEIPE